MIPVLKQAGEAILEVYNNQEINVNYKADDSPLTQADTAANEIIESYLKNNFDFPVISEEGKEVSFEERKEFQSFWLVDPLDGTKEFINRNGEFTVNIALVSSGSPVFGAIYVPVQDTYYFGDVLLNKAYKKQGKGDLVELNVNKSNENLVAVGSKSHASMEELDFYTKAKVEKTLAVGSSLKFCMIAEGKADLYYRNGPTMEWDTAAGQAIVKAAGGNVYTDLNATKEFFYNKTSLKNGSFLCASNLSFLDQLK